MCQSVCSKGQLCKLNPGACEFTTCKKVGPANGKCGLQDRCPFKVIFRRKKGGKQSGGDQFSVSGVCSIFDHSLTCGALGASSQQLTQSMLFNSPVAHSMLSSCKNVNIPEIINAVEREQGASAGAARTSRRWVAESREPKSMIDPKWSMTTISYSHLAKHLRP